MDDAKIFISANQLLEDSFRLGNMVLDSGFAPTHLVGIWRGGTPVGIAVQELLDYRGVHCHPAAKLDLERILLRQNRLEQNGYGDLFYH